MIPPLAIIQARLHSTRLPRKMLLDLGGHPLIWWAWDAAVKAFGDSHVVVACPDKDVGELQGALPLDARFFGYVGLEDDVLGRFWQCAHTYRWHPESVIVRITPDDPFKDADALRAVALCGLRLPVEIGGEAFTLAQLDAAHAHNVPWTGAEQMWCRNREHITAALFAVPPPAAPPGVWTVDTQADLEAARRKLEQ